MYCQTDQHFVLLMQLVFAMQSDVAQANACASCDNFTSTLWTTCITPLIMSTSFYVFDRPILQSRKTADILGRDDSCHTLGPWPWPRDTFSNFLANLSSSASLSRSAMGSAPGDSTKMRGVTLLESWKAPARLNGGGSVKALPKCSATKPCIAGNTYTPQQGRML